MISVAMATYNGEKFILQQLDSIKNQTCPPDEVIICDDQSNDNTVAIINQYIEKNHLGQKWKVIVNDKNLGYIKNFLNAISCTSGDYIFLSDQDDIFYPNKFQIMSDFFDKHPDCVLINANYEIIDENGNLHETYRTKARGKRKKTSKKLSFREWLYTSSFPGFSMAITASVRERIRNINIDNCYGHDQLLGLIAISMDGNYAISDVLSGYRMHFSNTTGGKNILDSYSISDRVKQKEKELTEYMLLREMIAENDIVNVDLAFITQRERELTRRIYCLKNRQIIDLACLVLQTKAYPRGTLLGDCWFVLKGKK